MVMGTGMETVMFAWKFFERVPMIGSAVIGLLCGLAVFGGVVWYVHTLQQGFPRLFLFFSCYVGFHLFRFLASSFSFFPLYLFVLPLRGP